MMQIFERQMRKVFDKNGKLKEYNISLGVNSNINEDRFYIKQKDKKTKNKKDIMVCDVLICFPDEYEEFHQEHEEFQSKIQRWEQSKSDHEETIKNLKNQLSNIEEKHQKEMENFKNENSQKVDQLKEDLHDKDIEIERIKAEYEKKIGDLKSEHQKKINDLKLFDEEYHMKKEEHEKALNNMRGNCLKLRVRENKKYSSYMDKLENLGRFEKFRNKDKPIIKEMRSLNKSSIDEDAIDINYNLLDKGK